MDRKRRIGGSDFVWAIAKAAADEKKHGVRFEDAATVFADPLFKLVEAGRNDEARLAAIGFDAGARLLLVVRRSGRRGHPPGFRTSRDSFRGS